MYTGLWLVVRGSCETYAYGPFRLWAEAYRAKRAKLSRGFPAVLVHAIGRTEAVRKATF